VQRHLLRISVLLAVFTAIPSCLSYHARFDKAVAAAAGVHQDPTGAWKGTWKSNWNGHQGPLWCIVTETPDKPGSYDFRYRAGWGVIQFGNYVHAAAVDKTPEGTFLVKGKMELPKLVGTHSLEGIVTKDAFDASYKSDKGDHGTMILRRPPGVKAAPPAPPLR
jgi:hypothetical protein